MSQHKTAVKKTRPRLLLLAPVAGLFCLSLALPSFAKTPAADPEAIILKPSEAVESPETLADKYALMALFAKTSYRKDIEDSKRNDNPCAKDTARLPQHWKRSKTDGACYEHKGLYYETYEHTNGQKIDMAVIAIRGTEPGWYDWKSNASGIVPFIKSEYTDAKDKIIPLIGALKTEGVDKIYLTGHSLGGGIAQTIAYATSETDVTATYTFNTSPVTNWMKLKIKHQVINKNPTVYSVYTSNEALAYVRNITKRFNFKLPNRTAQKLKYDFPKHWNPLNAHAMSNLTCYLAEQVPNDGAQFDYSKLDADEVLKDRTLCP